MLRVTELVEGKGSFLIEKTTFINKASVISVSEDVAVSKSLAEQRGTPCVVSRVCLSLPEGTRTLFVLGSPDAIMNSPRPTQKGILHG